MGRIKFDKTDKTFLMFQDFWKLYQKHYIPEDKEVYWNILIKECDEFAVKYGTCIARRLALDIVEDFERRFKMQQFYASNEKFREYVDKYCTQNKIGTDEALEHYMVKQVYDTYRKEVGYEDKNRGSEQS